MKGREGGRVGFRLRVEYDGSRFHGWQRQSERQTAQGIRTVSGALERVLDAPQHLDQGPPDLREGRRGVIADKIRTIAHLCASASGVRAGAEVAGAG